MRIILIENSNYMIYLMRATDNVNEPYLDVHVGLKSRKHRLHGVVGQTSYYIDELPRQSFGIQGEGIIEGTHLDYEVSGPWGTDFKYNRF